MVRKYNTVLTQPEESILVYSINSVETCIMMPELGSKLMYKEGLKLMRRCIKAMDLLE